MALLEEEKVVAAKEETAPKTEEPVDNSDVIDIALPEIKKQRFRIKEDNNRIIELNTADAGIINRLHVLEPKMEEVAATASEYSNAFDEAMDSETLSAFKKADAKFKEIDKKLRSMIDELFEAKVADVMLLPDGSEGSYSDVHGGKFNYEIVIEKLLGLYSDNIRKEYAKMEKMAATVNKKTAKYTKKKK